MKTESIKKDSNKIESVRNTWKIQFIWMICLVVFIIGVLNTSLFYSTRSGVPLSQTLKNYGEFKFVFEYIHGISALFNENDPTKTSEMVALLNDVELDYIKINLEKMEASEKKIAKDFEKTRLKPELFSIYKYFTYCPDLGAGAPGPIVRGSVIFQSYCALPKYIQELEPTEKINYILDGYSFKEDDIKLLIIHNDFLFWQSEVYVLKEKKIQEVKITNNQKLALLMALDLVDTTFYIPYIYSKQGTLGGAGDPSKKTFLDPKDVVPVDQILVTEKNSSNPLDYVGNLMYDPRNSGVADTLEISPISQQHPEKKIEKAIFKDTSHGVELSEIVIEGYLYLGDSVKYALKYKIRHEVEVLKFNYKKESNWGDIKILERNLHPSEETIFATIIYALSEKYNQNPESVFTFRARLNNHSLMGNLLAAYNASDLEVNKSSPSPDEIKRIIDLFNTGLKETTGVELKDIYQEPLDTQLIFNDIKKGVEFLKEIHSNSRTDNKQKFPKIHKMIWRDEITLKKYNLKKKIESGWWGYLMGTHLSRIIYAGFIVVAYFFSFVTAKNL